MVGTIDEAAPHNDAAMRLQGTRQHVGTVGMRAVVVARTGLSLAVGLDEKASEVGYQPVYLVGLLLPPGSHIGIQRVGRLSVTQGHGRSEVNREVGLDAVRAQYVSYLLDGQQIGCCQHLRRGIDIIEHRTVNAYRGIGTGILLNDLRFEI